jgi:hypothetical protein
MGDNIVPLRLTTAAALEIIRDLANDTSRIAFVPHAKKQMRSRRINRTQVYRCLRHGTIIEGPYKDIKGSWKCTLAHFTAGDNVKVVVAFESQECLVVITAM